MKNVNWLKRGGQIALSGTVAAALVLGIQQYQASQVPTSPGQTPVAISQSNSAPAIANASTQIASEQQTINLYQSNSGSVVNVTTRSMGYNQYMEMVPRSGAGSGFVIDKEGHVVTNYHVVQGAQRFFVAFGNVEQSYPAELIGFDESNDLAVLRVKAPAELLKPVALGDSSNLQVGQSAIAIGNPFALGQTITTGVVSSLNRSLQAEQGRTMTGLIQTDAAINQGNSGGPLFDSRGRVIGVNTLIYSPSGGSVGIGFAIPINTVKRFIPDLIKYGYARHPYLGVAALPLSPRLSQLLKLSSDQGLLVVETVPGSPAQKAGIKGGDQRVLVGNYEVALGGDIILSVDGQPMKNEQDLSNYLQSQKQVGETIEVSILRKGQGQPVTVKIPLTAARE